jgi:hypothetical protein
MAITQVGSANTGPGSSSTTTLTLTKPSGVASGHLLVAIVTSIGSSSSITGPSGWTEVDTATSGGGMKMSLWAKIAGGSEGSNYSWTETSLGSQRFVGTITAWDGVDVTSLATAINTSTEHDVVGNTSTPTAQTSPTLGSSAFANGRVFYARSCRIATNTPITFTESSGSASEMTDHGNNGSSSGISYSHVFALADADFSGAGSKAGLSTTASNTPTDNVLATWVIQMEGVPADGTLGATLAPVTSSFAATREIPTGTVSASLSPVVADFAGTAAPPEGSMAASLAPVVADLAGSTISGALDASLAPVSAALAGAVIPGGSLEASLAPVTVSFGTETKPFGEHVIRVEAEHRAFSVIDDDPGLTPILRSQVWEQVVPTINAQAGEVYVSVVANDVAASVPVSAPAGHASVSATAFAASAATSSSTSASAGHAAASVAANGASTALRPGAGLVSVSGTAQAPTVTTSGSANAPAGHASVSAVANAPSKAVRASAGLVSVSVAANAATVATNSSTNASAGHASATATANAATVRIGPQPELVHVSCTNALGDDLLKFAQSVGDGTNTSYGVTHNFGSRDVIVRVYDNTTYEEVQPKTTHNTTNQVTVEFAAAPATNAYRVVVLYSSL